MGGSISKLTSNEQRGGTTKYTSDESSLDFVVAYYIPLYEHSKYKGYARPR